MARILVVSNLINSLTKQRAGVGKNNGHTICWYSIPASPIDGIDKYDGPPNVPLRVIEHALSPIYFARTLLNFKPDLIHVHWAIQRLLTPFLTRFNPLVVTVMGGDILPERKYRGVNKYFVKQLLDSADVITSKSDFMDKALCQIGSYHQKIERITWGVNLDKFTPTLDVRNLMVKLGIDSEDFVFFCMRNCRPLYNKHLVIRSFEKCLKAVGNKSLKLIFSEANADTKYLASIKQMVRDLKIGAYVRFVETIPHQEMPLYYNLAHVGVSIPSSDGMPQSLYEGMACGLFFLLGALPQYDELITASDLGYLVSLDQGEEVISEAMTWCVENYDLIKKTRVNRRSVISAIANKQEQVDLMNSIYINLLRKYAKSKCK